MSHHYRTSNAPDGTLILSIVNNFLIFPTLSTNKFLFYYIVHVVYSGLFEKLPLVVYCTAFVSYCS